VKIWPKDQGYNFTDSHAATTFSQSEQLFRMLDGYFAGWITIPSAGQLFRRLDDFSTGWTTISPAE